MGTKSVVSLSFISMLLSIGMVPLKGVWADTTEDYCGLNSDLRHFHSGPWNGVYVYEDGRSVDQWMDLHLEGDSFEGSGSDTEVGKYLIAGAYNHATGRVSFIKKYPDHSVAYEGELNEGFMRGNWKVGNLSGSFQLLMMCSFPSPSPSPQKPPESLLNIFENTNSSLLLPLK